MQYWLTRSGNHFPWVGVTLEMAHVHIFWWNFSKPELMCYFTPLSNSAGVKRWSTVTEESPPLQSELSRSHREKQSISVAPLWIEHRSSALGNHNLYSGTPLLSGKYPSTSHQSIRQRWEAFGLIPLPPQTFVFVFSQPFMYPQLTAQEEHFNSIRYPMVSSVSKLLMVFFFFFWHYSNSSEIWLWHTRDSKPRFRCLCTVFFGNLSIYFLFSDLGKMQPAHAPCLFQSWPFPPTTHTHTFQSKQAAHTSPKTKQSHLCLLIYFRQVPRNMENRKLDVMSFRDRKCDVTWPFSSCRFISIIWCMFYRVCVSISLSP